MTAIAVLLFAFSACKMIRKQKINLAETKLQERRSTHEEETPTIATLTEEQIKR